MSIVPTRSWSLSPTEKHFAKTIGQLTVGTVFLGQAIGDIQRISQDLLYNARERQKARNPSAPAPTSDTQPQQPNETNSTQHPYPPTLRIRSTSDTVVVSTKDDKTVASDETDCQGGQPHFPMARNLSDPMPGIPVQHNLAPEIHQRPISKIQVIRAICLAVLGGVVLREGFKSLRAKNLKLI